MCRISILVLMILTLIAKIFAHGVNAEVHNSAQESNVREFPADYSDEEYIRHIHSLHSMINAYRSDTSSGGHLVIETNALIDTKYRTWKRNADLINSLLSLPKGMNEAGR